MSERSQSPESQNRPYDFSRNNLCAQGLGPEVLAAAAFQFPHGVLQEPGLFSSKTAYGSFPGGPSQTLFPFPPVSTGEYRGSEAQAGDFGQPRHWYPFTAPEYTGQVPGATTATQPVNLSPPIGETREQIKLPEIKTEKESSEDYSTEVKAQQQQQYPTASTAMPHGVFYPAAWNPTFWPGISHMTQPGGSNPEPSASSPSLSPSPPSSGLPSSAFCGVNATQAAVATGVAATQNQASSTRSSGSSSGGCSDSEEVRSARVFARVSNKSVT